jgi:hypothetical protein
MKIQEFITYIEQKEGKKIEEICKDMEDQTILWVNSGVAHKYELLLWDADFQEVTIRNVDRIMKDHPKRDNYELEHSNCNNCSTSFSSSNKY